MASAATQKWNARFARAKKPVNAAKVLHNHIEFLPQQGTAVDLACGLGGNALLLANHGLATSAWDAAEIGLAKLQLFAAQQQLTVTTRQVDLESDIFPAQTFDIVTVSHYLHRPLFPKIIAALAFIPIIVIYSIFLYQLDFDNI